MGEEIQKNIRPSWIHPQHQPCYKFCPSPDGLFHLYNLFINCSREELVGWLPMLPRGFYVINIFERLLSDIESLQSAEDGKIYIFSPIKIKDNGQHDCKTVDGGSWVKQGLVDKKEDLGLRVQSATFYTKLKKRTNWSMDLYSIRGQERALCVIRNTSPKRKVDSSNGMLPGQRQRLEQPLHQENEHTHVASLYPTADDAFNKISFRSNSGGTFQSYGDGRTASLSDMFLQRYHHNSVSQTDVLIEPTPETFLSACGTHMVQHRELIQESPTFNLSPYYSTSTFNVSGMFEEMDNFPVSTNTFPSDSKYIEETHDPRASENSLFYGLGQSASENQP